MLYWHDQVSLFDYGVFVKQRAGESLQIRDTHHDREETDDLTAQYASDTPAPSV